MDSGNAKPQISNACARCQADILAFLNSAKPTDNNQSEQIRLAGEILRLGKLPLICGLTDQALEVQQSAVQLAKRCHAVVDWTTGNSPFALQNALQDTGMVSCTFQEIRDRADLVIFWSCNIAESHPGFIQRFVSGKPTLEIDWDRQKQTRAMRFLREHANSDSGDGVPELFELKQKIDDAAYPVIVIDDSLAPTLGETGVLSLFHFVRAQNDRNHCRLIHLSKQQNATGIQSTLSATAGAPFGVAFRNGKPMFRGREFSVESLLSRGLVDVLMLVGSPDQLPDLEIAKHVRTIWISDREHPLFDAEVVIRTSRWGLDCDGTGIRDDGVPVFRKAICDSVCIDGVHALELIASSLPPSNLG